MQTGVTTQTYESEVAALGRALAVERRARFIDFRGKRSTFSQFMRHTANRLCRRYPMDGRWPTIRALFTQYANLDVASRISIIRRTEELLFPDQRPILPDEPPTSPHGVYRSPESKSVGAGAESDGLARAEGKPLAAGAERNCVAAGAEPTPIAGAKSNGVASRLEPKSVVAGAGSKSVVAGAGSKSSLAAAGSKSSVAGAEPGTMPATSMRELAVKDAHGKNAHGMDEVAPEILKEKFAKPAAPVAPKVVPSPGKPEKREKPVRPTPDPSTVDIKYVKGVGPKIAEIFERLGIFTAADLIRHYPRRHLDFQNRLLIRELRPGQEVTVFGTIKSVGAFASKKGNISILTIVISDGTGSVVVSRFIGGRSNKYLMDRYKAQYPKGAQVLASGVVERDRYTSRLQLKNAEIEILSELGDSQEEMSSLHTNRLVPVYPLTEGLGLRHLRNVIHNALEQFDEALIDQLPESIRLQYNLLGLKDSLWGIHFPEDVDTKDEARRRLVFDELFAIQLQMANRRYQLSKTEDALALALPTDGKLEQFRERLPFKLTGAQERVFMEIARDLASNKPMHRLVQGDVGSGKTVVAAMAALIAISSGYQVAVMAPTEILAEQHFRQFQKWLMPLGLRCALFLGKQGTKERREMQQALLSGQVHVAVGTHALIQDEVEFAKLGLIIIDEQHRFGVKQRAKLKAKGYNPELLTMTATPIPRTLALTMHGDLDVSEIDELPPGRKPVLTKVMTPGEKRQVHEFIRGEIQKGRQAYIVFPLIEESETMSAKAATVEYETLRQNVFPELNIGLMHGKLKPQAKEDVMDRFRSGEFQILVCTTVIEVGVDVPNASIMVIENADRFGLAQLHQLRGRVGRGSDQSYCYLIANAGSETTRQRLEIMEKTNDGFVVAEKDLELRGPGEFLGVRQSGMPDLFLADLVNDVTILEQARTAAISIFKTDPELKEHATLRTLLQSKSSSESAEFMQSG